MRPIVLVVGLAALMNVACGGTVNVEQERAALLERDRAWSESVQDAEKFLAFLAPDASMYSTGMPVVTGPGPLREMHTQMTSMPGTSLSWTANKAEVAGSGDFGYTTGAYEMGVAGMTPDKGKYVTVWKKSGGQWLVVEDIFNSDAGAPPEAHVTMAPSSLVWGPAPPSLPPGAKIAVISGDPSKPVPFVLRAQVPAGYRIGAHWHPGDENVTVLSGTIAVGMGDTWDDAKLESLPGGGYVALPAQMRHFFLSRTASTFQINGMGPFEVNYVNAADDPRMKK